MCSSEAFLHPARRRHLSQSLEARKVMCTL
ncbi:MAG: hypothetical protein GQ524_01680 [Anaerolineales bacterium]|nr:hypothetical protein [Anaerolineales bacterium]